MMMETFTANLEKLARNYNISPNDCILAYAVAAGADIADAFRATHKPTRKSSATVENLAKNHLDNTPGLRVLIAKLKRTKRNQTTEPNEKEKQEIKVSNVGNEEVDELRTRAGIITKLSKEVTATHGKDAVSGLQTLAKLQGFDKPEENESEEVRKFFVPFVSRCRDCALCRIYRDLI